MRSYEAPDLRKDSIDLARRRRSALSVHADQHRFAARRPGHGNVAKGVLAVVAGLVADPPAFGQAGAQSVVSGLAAQHPACETLARVWRQYLPEYEAPQVAGHGGGRGAVVRIAGRRAVQLRFVVIQAAYHIADGSPKCG